MSAQATEGAIYPRLLRRVRAVLIDEVIPLGGLAGWWLSIGITEDGDLALKVGALVLVFFILDPLLVALTGGTVGHHVMGMKVRAANRNAKVSLLAATFRALVRYEFWLDIASLHSDNTTPPGNPRLRCR